MRYEPTEELTQLLHHFDTRYQEEKISISEGDIVLPIQLLVNSIAKLAEKSREMSKSRFYGENFRDLASILSKISAYQTAPSSLQQKIIDDYNFIGRRFNGEPLSFSSEEIFAIDAIYALEHKQRQFYVENFNEKFQTLDEAGKAKFIEIIFQLTNIHLNDLRQRFYRLDDEGYEHRKEKFDALRVSMQLAVSNRRMRDKQMMKEVGIIEKKRKQEQKSLESNDSNQSNINNNSTLFASKKAKTADSSNNNDYLYNGDDETIASHEHESKEPPPSPTK